MRFSGKVPFKITFPGTLLESHRRTSSEVSFLIMHRALYWKVTAAHFEWSVIFNYAPGALLESHRRTSSEVTILIMRRALYWK